MEQERTFTQAEVNQMIQSRLAEEKRKYQQQTEAAFAEREKAITARERKISAREKLSAAGLSADLADVLDNSTDEALDNGIATLQRVYGEKTPTKETAKEPDAKPIFSKPLYNQFSSGGSDPLRGAFGLDRSKG